MFGEETVDRELSASAVHRCFVQRLSACIKFSVTDSQSICHDIPRTTVAVFRLLFSEPKVALLGFRNRVSWQTVSSASTKMSGLIKPVHDGGGEASLCGRCCHLSGFRVTTVD